MTKAEVAFDADQYQGQWVAFRPKTDEVVGSDRRLTQQCTSHQNTVSTMLNSIPFPAQTRFLSALDDVQAPLAAPR